MRQYLVCPRCVGSWVYADRVGVYPLCNKCWQPWPQPEDREAKGAGKRSRSRARRTARSQDQWDTAVEPPPGIQAAGRQKPKQEQSQQGQPQGVNRRVRFADQQAEVDPTVIKKLFEGANPETVALLKAAGLHEPAPTQPSLSELCQQHIRSLPTEIQEALSSPVVEPSQAQAASTAGKALKDAAAALRSAVGSKVGLQAKLDKAHAAYKGLLAEMQNINLLIEEQQQEVRQCQEALQQTAAAVPEPQSLPDILGYLSSAGIALSEEQRAKLQATVGGGPQAPNPDATNLQNHAEGVRMPVDLTAVEELSQGVSADIIRSLRQDLINSQQMNVQNAQKIQQLETALAAATPKPPDPPAQAEGTEPPSKKPKGDPAKDRSRSPKSKQQEEG